MIMILTIDPIRGGGYTLATLAMVLMFLKMMGDNDNDHLKMLIMIMITRNCDRDI